MAVASEFSVPEPGIAKPVRVGWQWPAFLLLNGLILTIFFWPAIIGRSMLAPLDIAPNFFPKFRYVDPNANGVPANHYVIDLMFGDVSRNLLVHEAWRRGEMPWWDPYTDGGKPLAAEANAVNICDPFKVILFHVLPFESAYNWIRILPFFLSGLTAFALLRQLGSGFNGAMWGALLYEFAGCNFALFSGPTVQASFAYYPLLWLLWHLAIQRHRVVWFALSTLITALIFLSGNLQSHSYVFLFALAFLIGYGWKRPERWGLLVGGTAFALFLGLGLAAPFLMPQIELYFLSARKLQGSFTPVGYLGGLASAATLFPWALGTFRTLDFSKAFGQGLLGFWIYIGSAAFIIAIIGATRRTESQTTERDVKRTASALVVVYFIVCSTPLVRVLYTRTAWLAVLGLVVLFTHGWTFLRQRAQLRKNWALGTLLAAGLIVLGCNIAGGVIYPRIQSRVEARFLEAQKMRQSLDEAEPLRRFQIRNFAKEVTFKNPETVVAFAGLIALGLFLLKPARMRTPALNAILILSTLPLLSFGHRYIPMHSFTLWNKIRTGGPEQHRVITELEPQGLRLLESAPGAHEFVFPGGLAQLFHVHTLHGHSSLMLSNVSFLSDASGTVPARFYDVEYRSEVRGLARGELRFAGHAGPSRFQWSNGTPRKVAVKNETLNTLMLTLERGGAEDLIRTDSFYPGWRAFSGATELKVRFEAPCFSRIRVPPEATELRFVYEPRHWRTGLWIAGLAGTFLSLWLIATFQHRNNA